MDLDKLVFVAPGWTLGLAAAIAVVSSVICYRLVLHPLAEYPGPFWARISGFYAVYHAYIGDVHLDMWKCHEKYGDFVRYGPDKVIIRTNTAIPAIYARTANVQKSTAYRAFETSPTAHDLQSTVNKKEHARKRRVICQAFSDSAIRSLECYIMQHVNVFIGHLGSAVSGIDHSERKRWSPKRDMAQLCESYCHFETGS